jgi:hypothetical protein
MGSIGGTLCFGRTVMFVAACGGAEMSCTTAVILT